MRENWCVWAGKWADSTAQHATMDSNVYGTINVHGIQVQYKCLQDTAGGAMRMRLSLNDRQVECSPHEARQVAEQMVAQLPASCINTMKRKRVM